jgi:hypothetical protein
MRIADAPSMSSDAGVLLEFVSVVVLCVSVIGSWGVFSGVRRRSP